MNLWVPLLQLGKHSARPLVDLSEPVSEPQFNNQVHSRCLGLISSVVAVNLSNRELSGCSVVSDGKFLESDAQDDTELPASSVVVNIRELSESLNPLNLRDMECRVVSTRKRENGLLLLPLSQL